MIAEIVRMEQSEEGTYGVLKINGRVICLTLERPWENNKPNVSCIPEGIYLCKRVKSPKFGDTFEVTDVPGRTHILFHKGNKVQESLGCVILGSSYSDSLNPSDVRGVKDSTRAFSFFMKALYTKGHFALQIKSV